MWDGKNAVDANDVLQGKEEIVNAIDVVKCRIDFNSVYVVELHEHMIIIRVVNALVQEITSNGLGTA